jgi:hypothetical protein
VVFWDQPGIKRGDPYNEIIEKAINASRLFVLLLSANVINAHDSAIAEGGAIPYIEKEVSLAWKWRENTTVYPYIIDDSNPSDYRRVFPEVFGQLDLGHEKCAIEQIPRDICSKMDELQIYPSEIAKERFQLNKEVDEGLKSIKPLIRSLLDECSTCPRFLSTVPGVSCPFIHSSAHSDWSIYNQESERRTRENVENYGIPEPIHPDVDTSGDLDSQRDWEEEVRDWEGSRFYACMVYPEQVRQEYEKLYGSNHSGVSINRPCGIQDRNREKLERIIILFGKPLFQKSLFELEPDLVEIDKWLGCDDAILVAKRFGLFSYLRFITQQLLRKWNFKRDLLETLAREQGVTSISDLLLEQLENASSCLADAMNNNSPISVKNNPCFLVIWWLLRNNSSFLTQMLLVPSEIAAIRAKIKEFCEQYERMKSSSPLFVDSVIPFGDMDSQEENQKCPVYSVFGYNLSDYQWIVLNDWEQPLCQEELLDGEKQEYQYVSYVCDSELDECQNPIYYESPFGLSRGIRKQHSLKASFSSKLTQRKRLRRHIGATESNDDYPATLCLYPIVKSCQVFAEMLSNSERIRDISRITLNSKIGFNYFEFVDPDPEGDNGYGVRDYHALLYPDSSTGVSFNDAVRLLSEGSKKKGFEMMVSLTEKHDLEAIVYMANYYAYKQKKYSKAIALYEIASENGVEFCYARLAECYERIGDYRQAFRWYIVSDELSANEGIKLRIGVCCYHLNMLRMSQDYFQKSGDAGQAAIYILGLYGRRLERKIDTGDPYYEEEEKNDIDDTLSCDQELEHHNDYQQLELALHTKIKQADRFLGDFSSIHYEPGVYSVERRIDYEQVEEEAQDSNPESQYLLGILQMEEELASDEFLNNALKWIRMAANNGNPDALCLLGRYLKKFRNNMSEGDRLLEKALLKLYPSPFPELQKNV